MQRLRAWLRLTLTPGLGPRTGARLLSAFGLPESVLGAPLAQLGAVAGADIARRLVQGSPALDEAVDRSLTWAQQPGCHIVALDDPRFPPQLLQIPDPPLLLWVKGQPALLSRPALAIVGSRHASQSGLQDAQALAAALGGQGLTIVSGLARGVDAAAHRGALHTPGGTVAVLGTGIERVYPRQQLALSELIAQRGALISELDPTTDVRRDAFPRRNRLIAGLSMGVLVVEAALQSGSLITARLAADFGRDVFAMPGSIHAPTARGCHRLIKDGATLVEQADDILADPQYRRAAAQEQGGGTAAATRPAIDRQQQALIRAMGWAPVDAATLLSRLSSSPSSTDVAAISGAPSQLMHQLVGLELAGLVERLADGRFQRLPG